MRGDFAYTKEHLKIGVVLEEVYSGYLVAIRPKQFFSRKSNTINMTRGNFWFGKDDIIVSPKHLRRLRAKI